MLFFKNFNSFFLSGNNNTYYNVDDFFNEN